MEEPSIFTLIARRLSLVFCALCTFSVLKLSSQDLMPFTSDGCSAFPDGTMQQKKLWLACCTAHDKAYWLGGTYQQRLEADKILQHCVAQVGEPHIALIMLAGVRVGGSPFWPTRFRWGYGWEYPRFYGQLSPGELSVLKNLTSKDQDKRQ